MRTAILCSMACLVFLAGTTSPAAEKKQPERLVFKAKTGDVTFDHSQHVKAAKNECKTCHTKLWPQDISAPLNFKAGMHKPAEAGHTSCGFCHHAGGGSFETKGNCNRCHVKEGSKAKS